MFAPSHHAAMKHAAPVRKELGVRTIFNILGPLTNPAGAPNQVMGVFHPDLVGIQVRVLQQLGSNHVLVVHGKDGMDEVSLGAATLVGELKDGEVREYEIHPEDFGLAMVSNRTLKVSSPAESRAMLLEAMDNVVGTPREIVIFNAGVALYAANVADSIGEGMRRRVRRLPVAPRDASWTSSSQRLRGWLLESRSRAWPAVPGVAGPGTAHRAARGDTTRCASCGLRRGRCLGRRAPPDPRHCIAEARCACGAPVLAACHRQPAQATLRRGLRQ